MLQDIDIASVGISKDEVLAELARPKKYAIMACGLTGVGKSTLLNGIIGENFFKVGDALQHETTRVDKLVLKKGVYSLTVYDTPGFCDDSGNEHEYLQSIRENCREVNTLLYCISVRSNKGHLKMDLATLQNLKAVLKDNVWNQCIIVLTFSNHIVNKLIYKKHINLDKEFEKSITEWKRAVKNALISSGIPEIIVDEIPMVPAGSEKTPSLLSNGDYWFSTLWYTIMDRANDDGIVVLTYFNENRLTTRSTDSIKSLTAKALPEQPILPPKTWLDSLKAKHPTIGAAVGVGGTAGVSGAAIGATIGALTIGIPSFGIAAGVGLVLGAVIGGGAGIGVGVITGKAIETVKKKKEMEKNTAEEQKVAEGGHDKEE